MLFYDWFVICLDFEVWDFWLFSWIVFYVDCKIVCDDISSKYKFYCFIILSYDFLLKNIYIVVIIKLICFYVLFNLIKFWFYDII